MEVETVRFTGRRFDFKSIPLSLGERMAHWFRGVKWAILEIPPKSRTVEFAINPGELGYEDAPMVETVTTYSLGTVQIYDEHNP